jgi:hypothetical protein
MVESKYILYLRFFKVSTLCLDDSFANSWHSLNQLHEFVIWNAFILPLRWGAVFSHPDEKCAQTACYSRYAYNWWIGVEITLKFLNLLK